MPTSPPHPSAEATTSRLLAAAKKHGGEAADAIVAHGVSLDASVRLGKLESVEHSESIGISLRVFVGKGVASVSSTSFEEGSVEELAERAVAMAKIAPADEFARLATPDQFAKNFPDCDLLDAYTPDADTLKTWAFAAEEAALAVSGISNSEGGGASFNRYTTHLATSNGFSAGLIQSGFSIGVAVLAEKNGAMEVDGDYHHTVHHQDLRDPSAIGTRAGTRTIDRLGAKRATTGQFPVVYDERVARSITRHIAGAINGNMIARGTSFLKDSMGEMIASPVLHLSDDPLVRRKPGSSPFDGEGLARKNRVLVEDGRLQGWLLDLASAKQLNLAPTGNAGRGGGAPSPATSNWIMRQGKLSRDELIADIKQGFLVTELIGSSVNLITGDYSRGASGFWIEGGAIAYPVTEATIAGNLNDMLRHITPANDADQTRTTICPSLR
ncbi:MAG: TldD/PmbA family protein, partial [Proteobacteria bacterium]|nr:TldD/PmbA family protein [Pseudomonadota bacterium]